MLEVELQLGHAPVDRRIGRDVAVDPHKASRHTGHPVTGDGELHAADIRQVLIRGNEPRRRPGDLLELAQEVAVRAEDQVDVRHRPGHGEIIFEVLVTDHDHGIDVIVVPQLAHGLSRGGDRFAEGEAAGLDQRLEVASGEGKYADPRAVYGEHGGTTKPFGVRAENRVAHRLRAAVERLPSIVGIMIAEGHGVDDAIEPWPFHTSVLVRPGRRALVDHVAAAEDESTLPLLGAQIGDGPGHPSLRWPLFRVERHGVGVVVGKLQEGHTRRRMRG